MSKIIQIGCAAAESASGVAKTIHAYCLHLPRKGWEVENWTFDPSVPRPVLDLHDGSVPHWRLPTGPLGGAFLCRDTSRWISSRRAEIGLLHLHSVFTPSNNALALFGVPFCVTPNGGWQPRVLLGRGKICKLIWLIAQENLLWRKAFFVGAVSRMEMLNLQKLPGIKRVVYTPNGVDIAPGNYRSKGPWLFLGRLAVAQKGIDQMIEGYALLKGRGRHPPKLLLAGPNFRDGVERIHRLIQVRGLQKDVLLLGEVFGEKKADLFKQSSLFIHTSRWEGIPHSILEALAHGLPCLLTAETNLGEEILQAKAGWCAGQGALAIAQSMEEALFQQDLWPTFSARAQKIVEDRYSWGIAISALSKEYKRILS